MHTDNFLLGAGGHGKVVLDVLLQQGEWPLLLDGDASKAGSELLGCEVVVLPESLTTLPRLGHVAIGNNRTRESLSRQLIAAGRELLTVCHQRAVIASSATLGGGCFVAANAVMGPDVEVGDGSIINHGVVVDHDSRVGRFCHLAPNATLGGEVVMGDYVLLGSGAVVLPGVRIGDAAVIGSGAVVTKDVAAGATVVGMPARVVNES